MREAGCFAEQKHQPHLLIAEDDVPLAHFLKRGLQADKCAVDVVHDGESAFQAAKASQYDLLILDLNLPKLDGMDLLRQLRPVLPTLPILVLTGRSRLEDRLMALHGGADDCMVKPFSFHELTARARALLRRHGSTATRCMQVADLLLDREEFRVERAGKRITLTPKEFLVLECLMTNARRPVSRSTLMEYVWKAPYDARTNLVDVYVKYVRDKIDAGFPAKLLRTIRGIGYVITDD
ncbi:MAG TPA: response regulator transcription factor [Terriglobales bacterium]|nr:response regulator transcription factor [Terriglobales bacterium]